MAFTRFGCKFFRRTSSAIGPTGGCNQPLNRQTPAQVSREQKAVSNIAPTQRDGGMIRRPSLQPVPCFQSLGDAETVTPRASTARSTRRTLGYRRGLLSASAAVGHFPPRLRTFAAFTFQTVAVINLDMKASLRRGIQCRTRTRRLVSGRTSGISRTVGVERTSRRDCALHFFSLGSAYSKDMSAPPPTFPHELEHDRKSARLRHPSPLGG